MATAELDAEVKTFSLNDDELLDDDTMTRLHGEQQLFVEAIPTGLGCVRDVRRIEASGCGASADSREQQPSGNAYFSIGATPRRELVQLALLLSGDETPVGDGHL